ncbi:MAG: hypothetical protein IJ744_10035 [Lachnospiraceae bacterium]|nr:hypothetical protein [Lachnospiraceae bacterium]
MKLYAIKDAERAGFLIGYLLYFPNRKDFFIEISEDLAEEEAPIFFDSFLRRGKRMVHTDWSKKWVQQRIIPPDRQNIAGILKEWGWKEYDEFRFLTAASGRCAQDEMYLEEIDLSVCPKQIGETALRTCKEVIPLKNRRLILLHRNDTAGIVDLTSWIEEEPERGRLQYDTAMFHEARLRAGGREISWRDNLWITLEELEKMETLLPFSCEELEQGFLGRLMETDEVCKTIDCTRQNVDYLIRKGKLHPVKKGARLTLFARGEVEGLISL